MVNRLVFNKNSQTLQRNTEYTVYTCNNDVQNC